jgi:PAS domain S-box-containing protein
MEFVVVETAEACSRDALMTDTAARTNGRAGGAARRDRPDGSARVAELEAEVAALRRALARAGLDAERAVGRHGRELAAERAGRTADAAGAGARHGREMAADQADLAAAEEGRDALRRANAELAASRAALREREERLRLVLDSATEYAIVGMDLDRRVTSWNAGAERLLGWTEAEIAGRSADAIFTPEDLAAGVPEQETAGALAEGRAADERWHQRRDGSRFWANGLMLPLRDSEAGPAAPPLGLLKIMRDRTAEREAEERLREIEERFRQVAGAIDDVFWISQPSPPRIHYLSPAFERVWGIPVDELLGAQTIWLDAIHPEDRDRVREAFYERALAEGRYDIEYRIVRPDGSVRWIHDRGKPVEAGPGGGGGPPPRRLAGLASDVTARHEAEERRRLLVGELNHRVKNTLATVQSLARQTGRAAASAAEFTAALEGRLLALARAHDLLTREDWRGATVADVAHGALAPHSASGRVSLSGPALRIGPREAVALAMALGELATNAAKHGALSAAGGRVSVSWRKAEAGGGGGILSWEESGGPPVAGPPARRGFGLRLLAQGLRQDLRAAAELDFAPGGLRCVVRFPVAGGGA